MRSIATWALATTLVGNGLTGYSSGPRAPEYREGWLLWPIERGIKRSPGLAVFTSAVNEVVGPPFQPGDKERNPDGEDVLHLALGPKVDISAEMSRAAELPSPWKEKGADYLIGSGVIRLFAWTWDARDQQLLPVAPTDTQQVERLTKARAALRKPVRIPMRQDLSIQIRYQETADTEKVSNLHLEFRVPVKGSYQPGSAQFYPLEIIDADGVGHQFVFAIPKKPNVPVFTPWALLSPIVIWDFPRQEIIIESDAAARAKIFKEVFQTQPSAAGEVERIISDPDGIKLERLTDLAGPD